MTSASVVVASRGRPSALIRCLRALEQQFHPALEVIVVADPAGCRAVGGSFPGRTRLIPFDRANLAEARNLGIAASAGAVVAFIDDDATAEPTWLERLCSALEQTGAAAAGGYVRGRNGISFQWRGREVDATGRSFDLDLPAESAALPQASPGRAVRFEGTNMAFRRDALLALGGFDPGFAFFHDDTDLALRLARQGMTTAVVPLAQVHHRFEASDLRRDDRMPRDLGKIGESSALLLRKHASDGEVAPRRAELRDEQRRRLLAHMLAGRCEPADVRRLLAGFDAGFERGLARPLLSHAIPGEYPPSFLPFATPPGGSVLIAGRPLRRRALEIEAQRLRAQGQIVTLVRLSRTALFHSTRFRDDGIWEHRGGIFGRSERHQAMLQSSTFAVRVARIGADIGGVRHIANAADATT